MRVSSHEYERPYAPSFFVRSSLSSSSLSLQWRTPATAMVTKPIVTRIEESASIPSMRNGRRTPIAARIAPATIFIAYRVFIDSPVMYI